MSTPKFSSFVKQYGQLWCKGKNFNLYTIKNMAHNNTENTVYVEHDPSVITLEEVRAIVITDHIEMYNDTTICRAENITLNDIIAGLNRLNFVTLK